MLRPDLLDSFSDSGLLILNRAGDTVLADEKGVKGGLSDHLPLVLKLNW